MTNKEKKHQLNEAGRSIGIFRDLGIMTEEEFKNVSLKFTAFMRGMNHAETDGEK